LKNTKPTKNKDIISSRNPKPKNSKCPVLSTLVHSLPKSPNLPLLCSRFVRGLFGVRFGPFPPGFLKMDLCSNKGQTILLLTLEILAPLSSVAKKKQPQNVKHFLHLWLFGFLMVLFGSCSPLFDKRGVFANLTGTTPEQRTKSKKTSIKNQYCNDHQNQNSKF